MPSRASTRRRSTRWASALTQPEYDIRLQRIAWDRLFFDPHSAEADFSDAGYLGIVTWMDFDDALAMYPDAKDMLDATLATAPSDTYDDKPKFSHWADKKRKRVRICQIWIKRAGEWYFAEFTRGGILKAGPSPYVTDKGESDCELILQSAYVDRDNNRYGLVREMITLQDEVNKRRSKSLHLLNTAQVVYETGAVADIEAFRKEAVRPDGTMEVAPGALANRQIEFRTRDDLATAHFQLLQEAKSAIDVKGPNATEMGDRTGGDDPRVRPRHPGQPAGRHDPDRRPARQPAPSRQARVSRRVGARAAILDRREVGARHRRRAQREMARPERRSGRDGAAADARRSADPGRRAAAIAGVIGAVAELDCDIVIDDAPDSLTPQIEQFQALVELKKYDAAGEIPVPRDRAGDAEPEGQAGVPEGHGRAGGSGKRKKGKRRRACRRCSCAAPRPKWRRRRARWR